MKRIIAFIVCLMLVFTAAASLAETGRSAVDKTGPAEKNEEVVDGIKYACYNLPDYTLANPYSHIVSQAFVTGAVDPDIKKIVIQAEVKSGGKTYKVVQIDAHAFEGLKKLTTVIIGKNVDAIQNDAFSNCPKLKSIQFKTTKIFSIGSRAFSGIKKGATFKCPSDKLKSYKTMLKKAGAPGDAKYEKK